MSKGKEIRSKVASIKKTRKITNAMQMVAAGKRRKAETRMKASIPYAEKLHAVVAHIMQSNSEFLRQPFLQKRLAIKRIGLIVVGTDRGLCGGLNINLFKSILQKIQEWQERDINTDLFLIGNKTSLFFKNLKINIRTQIPGLGDAPAIEDLIGTIKVTRDAYLSNEIDGLYIAYNEFVSTIVQKPIIKQLIPVPELPVRVRKYGWDYIYEPNSFEILQTLIKRFVEVEIYQAIVDNHACEQAARMVAMQNATDNAGKFINELQLIYNKARQAGITQEIIEIVSGAEAV